MASLLLWSFLARISDLKRTSLVIFYDVKTAFYAVIRQMLLPVHLSKEEYSVDSPLPLPPGGCDGVSGTGTRNHIRPTLDVHFD